MGGGREHGNSEEYDVEMRQVATLNRLAGPTIGGSGKVSERIRHRGADLLVTGHALARAASLGEALTLISQLADASLPLCGQAVFRSDSEVLKCVGHVGFRDGEDDALRLPLGTIHPATQVARTGRPVFLASPQEYRDRFPSAWQLGGQKRYEAWAFLPLTTYSQLTGVWMAAFDAPVRMADGLGPLLVTMARLLSQSIEQSYDGQADRALSQGLRSSMSRIAPGLDGLTVAARYVPTGGGSWSAVTGSTAFFCPAGASVW